MCQSDCGSDRSDKCPLCHEREPEVFMGQLRVCSKCKEKFNDGADDNI